MGISPDIIITRCDFPLDDSTRKKISLFCDVKPDCVIDSLTVPTIYSAPIMLENQNLSEIVCRELHIKTKPINLTPWKEMLNRIENAVKPVNIALVGKYVKMRDAYLSVSEALRHGGYEKGAKVNINWIESESLTYENAENILGHADGIIVPGGFGDRGILGKIVAANYARTHNIPYFGICLGMQIAVIEYARNVCGLPDADSAEFSKSTQNKVIDLMPDQNSKQDKGGTMRLGAYPCEIQPNTVLHNVYGKKEISERHRHRYEFNNNYREIMTKNDLVISGTSPDGKLVEAVEISNHPFYVGVQFHPEFLSRPDKAHPLFKSFIQKSLEHRENK